MGMVFGVIREEMPRYAVVHSAASYEVRRYGPSLIVETSFGASGWGGDGGDGSPFGALARYIGVFGEAQNQAAGAGEKIAMTAPVLVTPKAEPVAMTAPVLVTPQAQAADTMAFVLPASKYRTIAEVPKPTDPRVRLRELPERLQAARVFSWSFGADRAKQQLDLLLADLQADGWTARRGADGQIEWQAAGYNPPFALPFVKRNEVLVTVEEKEAGAAAASEQVGPR